MFLFLLTISFLLVDTKDESIFWEAIRQLISNKPQKMNDFFITNTSS